MCNSFINTVLFSSTMLFLAGCDGGAELDASRQPEGDAGRQPEGDAGRQATVDSAVCKHDDYADYFSQASDETLLVRIRNRTDINQYIQCYGTDTPSDVWKGPWNEPGWEGDGEYTLFNTHQTCGEILAGGNCDFHEDPGFNLLVIAPGAQYETTAWDGIAWKRVAPDRACNVEIPCECPQRIKAPAGNYMVRIMLARQISCPVAPFFPGCPCDPGDDTCFGPGQGEGEPIVKETRLNWPTQTEVVIDIE